jgi:hypothetical protein
MKTITKPIYQIIIYGLILGLVYTWLFYEQVVGTNAAIFNNLLAFSFLVLAYLNSKITWKIMLWAGFIILLGVFQAWRYSEFLMFWNRLGTSVIYLLLLAQIILPYKFINFTCRVVWRVVVNSFGSFRVLKNTSSDLQKITNKLNIRSEKSGAILRGVLLSLPIVYMFLLLFSIADTQYLTLVKNIFEFDSTWNNILLRILPRIIFFVVSSFWFVGSLLNAFVDRDSKFNEVAEPTLKTSIPIVELQVVLGILNVLFVSFIVLQLRYIFGGEANVIGGEFTYSEYAVSGYVEMLWIAGVSFGLITLMLKYIWNCQQKYTPGISNLVIGLVVQVLIILVSAGKRILLYISNYQLTEIRFYSVFFMIFVFILFVSILFVILKNKPLVVLSNIASITALAILVILNIVNPDAFIASYNIINTNERRVDWAYITSLSGDATKVITDAEVATRDDVEYCISLGNQKNRLLLNSQGVEAKLTQSTDLELITNKIENTCEK